MYWWFLDVLDFASYEVVVQKVRDIVGDKGLNALINNAGIMKEKKVSLSQMNVKDMTDTFVTNTVAPVMLVKVNVPWFFLSYFCVWLKFIDCNLGLFV